MENFSKAENIRLTLSVLDRYKYHFNLLGVLSAYIKEQEYPKLISEYRKGQKIFSDLIQATGHNNIRNISVFPRIWTEIERRVQEHRLVLWSRLVLQQSCEDICHTAGVLFELGVDQNPFLVAYQQKHDDLKIGILLALERNRDNVEGKEIA